MGDPDAPLADDDDLWTDEPLPPRTPRPPSDVPPISRAAKIGAAVAALVVVVVIVAVVASHHNSSDSPTEGAAATTAAGPGGSAPTGGSTAAATTPVSLPGPQCTASTSGRPPEFGKLNALPGAVTNKPAHGAYLWNGYDGWHLWVVDPGAGAKGTITSDAPLAAAQSDPAGQGTVTTADKTITFDYSSVPAGVVGFHFDRNLYAHYITIDLSSGTLPLFLGQAKAAQGSTPCVVPLGG